MRLRDVNLLLYAVDEESPRFTSAHAWVQDLFGGSETVALPWSVTLAFVGLTTKYGPARRDPARAARASCDADFSRFSGLRWRDPLSGGPEKRT